MVDSVILAMTAQEMGAVGTLPSHIAWLSCHFDPRGTGLTGLPPTLPKASCLILDDSILPSSPDPEQLLGTLSKLVDRWAPSCILLDFQRPWEEALASVATRLQSLPCPVAPTPAYARTLQGPVFLPPIPPHVLPHHHLAPWKGRQIYLEVALDTSILTVTADGCQITYLPRSDGQAYPHRDPDLHCHYRIDQTDDALRFTLARTPEDIEALLEDLDITAPVALYQEFGHMMSP